MPDKLDENSIKSYMDAYKSLGEQELDILRHDAALRPHKWTLMGIHELVAGIAGVVGVVWLLMTMSGLLETGVHKVTGADQLGWLVAGVAIVWGWWTLKVARDERQNDRTIVAAINRLQYDRQSPEFKKNWEGR